MKREFYSRIENYMLKMMKDSAHDIQHVYRVLNYALLIAQNTPDEIDSNVLIAACLLHDIGRGKQFENLDLCHAEIGSKQAKLFLKSLNCDDDFAEHVSNCILTHRLRKNVQPKSIEAKILFDADKLDSIGVIGIARILMYSGANSEPLYIAENSKIITHATTEEISTFFQEFNLRHSNIKHFLHTNYAKSLAWKKVEQAQKFYNDLYNEVNGTIENELISSYLD